MQDCDNRWDGRPEAMDTSHMGSLDVASADQECEYETTNDLHVPRLGNDDWQLCGFQIHVCCQWLFESPEIVKLPTDHDLPCKMGTTNPS
jgi:hypothetical protein